MGMFDDVRFVDGTGPKCAYGHVCADLQSKDWECDMTTYFVHDALLYKRGRGATETYSRDGDLLTAMTFVKHSRVAEHGTYEVHTFCRACEPIYIAKQHGWGGNVDEVQPLLSWNLIFTDGVLAKIEPVETPTREEYRRECAQDGYALLKDDDVVVLAHKKQKTRER